MQVQTVRIVSDVTEENPNGYIVINKDDFVEGQDELFLTEEEKAAAAAAAPRGRRKAADPAPVSEAAPAQEAAAAAAAPAGEQPAEQPQE